MADSNPLSALGLLSANDVDGKVPAAYWPGRDDDGILYEGCLGFIAGPSQGGKSTMMAKVKADWSRTRGSVIDMDGEDAAGMGKLRLEAAGADLSKIHYGEFYVPKDVDRLRAAILALSVNGERVLVVWDTADTWIEAPVQRWGKALHHLAHDVLPDTGATGIFIHHTLKNAKKHADWKQVVGGATAGIVGKSRFGFLYGPRPDDNSQRLLVQVKDSYREIVSNGAYHGIAFEWDSADLYDDDGVTVNEVACMRIAEKGVACADPASMVYLGGENGQRGPTPEKFAAAAEWLGPKLALGARPVSDAVQCVTNPDGDKLGGCGYSALSKVGDGNCPTCDGPVVLVQGLKESAEQEGISWSGSVRKVIVAWGCVSDRKGSRTADSGLVFSVRLPDGHPDALESDPLYRSVLA